MLVFVLAILPNTGTGAMHIYRAESPGPTAGKLVSKMKFTARILYLIYISLTVFEKFSIPVNVSSKNFLGVIPRDFICSITGKILSKTVFNLKLNPHILFGHICNL